MIRALEAKGYRVTGIDVDESLVHRLEELRPDGVFIALHGKGGEDGTVQELLEILGIPYTGSGVLASIEAMDKVLTKHILLAAKPPHPGRSTLSATPPSGTWAPRTRSTSSPGSWGCPSW